MAAPKVVVPVVRREGAVVTAIPGVIQRVTSVTFITINLQFVVLCFRIDLEMAVLGISVGKLK